jgi:glycosyltransferase involved in cell wall biosynthesis
MRILHVISPLTFGGPAVALRDLSKKLTRRGHINRIVTTDYGRNPKDIFLSEIKNADIVHIHGLWKYSTFVAARLCRRENKPYIIRTCGMLKSSSLAQKRLKKLFYYFLFEKRHLAGATLLQFTTEEELNKSKNMIGPAKTTILPIGVDPDYVKRTKDAQQPGLFNAGKYIIFLGRLHPQKRIELLTRAFAQFSQKNADFSLVFVGKGEVRYVNKVKRLIAALNLNGKVNFLDYIDGRKRFDILHRAKLSCVLSRSESFGLSIIESLYYKVPVVVTSTIDLAGEIQKVGCGFVCTGSDKDIACSMERIVASESLRKQMGERGHQWVKQNFIWNKLIPRYEKMYRNAVEMNKC